MGELVVIAACLFLNGVFAAYEMAFVSVPKPELRRLAQTGNKAAQRLLISRESPERTLSILQIGLTLVGAVSAAVGGAAASESVGPFFQDHFGFSRQLAEILSILAVVLPITYLNVVVGELVPKSLALRNPIKLVLWGEGWLRFAGNILAPAVMMLEWSTKQLLRVFFPRSKKTPPSPETAVEIGALPQHHQEAILNLAYIERKTICDILVPWKDVVRIKISDSIESIVPIIFETGHTRMPVVDHHDTVLGVLHTKEALALRETGNQEWQTLVRPILTVRPQDSLLAVLRTMQRSRRRMAVAKEAGQESALGIVTLEDISEEIWGEIYDEDDDNRIRKLMARRSGRAFSAGA